MKHILLYALLSFSLFSCAEKEWEDMADTQDALIQELATSPEYHAHQTMLRVTATLLRETTIDYEAIEDLMDQTGRNFREMEEQEFAHIEGATTLRSVHNLAAESIGAMKKRFPNYAQLPREVRLAALGQYQQNRGISTMDLLTDARKIANQ